MSKIKNYIMEIADWAGVEINQVTPDIEQAFNEYRDKVREVASDVEIEMASREWEISKFTTDELETELAKR